MIEVTLNLIELKFVDSNFKIRTGDNFRDYFLSD